MSRCLSLDLEVSKGTELIHAFAGVRPDTRESVVFAGPRRNLNQALAELDDLAEGVDFLLGHNLIKFDLRHLRAANPDLRLLGLPAVDTLWLNPLAFPRNPYHHLVKHYQDGQLERGRLNDPELDALLALEAFSNQQEELLEAPPDLLAAWHWLTGGLADPGFDLFFESLHSQVKTAKTIEAAPAVRDAVEEGRVSSANAKRLAEVIEKTSAEAVESDGELLAKAESMRPEQFAREARRWATDRQGDGGEADYRRLRAKRCLRIWDTDDGMVRLHGEFDPVTGRRIGNRLQAEARRLYDADKKQASRDSERRSFHQCMADALDALTANNVTATSKPFADICVVANVDDETGKIVAELAGGDRLPRAVLEEIACNAKFTGVVYDREGKPIWRTHSVRTATEAQRQILIAQYGGCFHCGANPAMCQIHHIKPVSQGGSTRLDNMVPVCWDCHQKIHHHGWQIRTSLDGIHTLHPPDRVNYGPARAPENPILHLPGIAPDPGPVPPRLPAGTAGAPERSELPRAGIPQAPDHRSTRSGPAAARAALREAVAIRNGTPTERAPCPLDAHAGPLW